MGKVCCSQSKHQHFLFQCWCILVIHLKEMNLKNKNKVWGSDRPLHLHGLLLPSLCGFQWNVMLVLVQPALFLWNCRKTFGEALTCYLEFHVNAHFFFHQVSIVTMTLWWCVWCAGYVCPLSYFRNTAVPETSCTHIHTLIESLVKAVRCFSQAKSSTLLPSVGQVENINKSQNEPRSACVTSAGFQTDRWWKSPVFVFFLLQLQKICFLFYFLSFGKHLFEQLHQKELYLHRVTKHTHSSQITIINNWLVYNNALLGD